MSGNAKLALLTAAIFVGLSLAMANIFEDRVFDADAGRVDLPSASAPAPLR